jgi:hypothetical protein
MNTGELLDELRQNILHDRSDRTDGDADLLWSDATLIRYIDEACRRFAREGLVIRDHTTPDVTTVTLQTDVAEYVLHDSILAVLSVRMDDSQRDLARTGHAPLGAYTQPVEPWIDTAALDSLPPGRPLVFTTDEGVALDTSDTMSAVNLRLYPAPSVDYNDTTVRLRVVRMPLYRLSVNELETVPDLPEIHHLDALDWAAYLALRIVDADAGHKARALEFRASFEEHVRKARRDAMRKLFAPMHWGFGRHGFSWER